MENKPASLVVVPFETTLCEILPSRSDRQVATSKRARYIAPLSQKKINT